VLFCSLMVVAFFWSCLGALCVVMCWMFEGCNRFVGGGGKGAKELVFCVISFFFCSVIFSGVGFVESCAFVVFAPRIWIGLLAVR